MNIQLMRKIDRGMGIPLCFMLTLVHLFFRLFKKSFPIKSPQKILFIEMSEMGSIILAYSSFLETKKRNPQADLYFLTFKENRHAAEILSIIPKDHVLTINNQNLWVFIFSTIKTLWNLRQIKLDVSVDLETFSRFSVILSYLSNAKNRVGFHRFNQEGLYRGRLLTHEVPFNPHIHMTQNMLNLIYSMSSPQSDLPPIKRIPDNKDIQIPSFNPPLHIEQKIQKKLNSVIPSIHKYHKMILVNPNASDIVPLRRWPIEHYIQLLRLIIKNSQSLILITGTSSERKTAQKIVKELNSDQCFSFAGKTSFPELIALYKKADLLITNDSGPVHFSAMTDINTFVFFGPETPDIFGPLGKNTHVFYKGLACSPCVSAFNQKYSPCMDNQCLKMISPDEIYEKVSQYLSLD